MSHQSLFPSQCPERTTCDRRQSFDLQYTRIVRQFSPTQPKATRLSASAPDTLEETVLLGKAVQGVVALAHSPHEAAEGVGLVLASVTTVLVNLADGNLDGGVVLGLDDAVGGRALAGDVAAVQVSGQVPISSNSRF